MSIVTDEELTEEKRNNLTNFLAKLPIINLNDFKIESSEKLYNALSNYTMDFMQDNILDLAEEIKNNFEKFDDKVNKDILKTKYDELFKNEIIKNEFKKNICTGKIHKDNIDALIETIYNNICDNIIDKLQDILL
jgi:hypothetical protein